MAQKKITQKDYKAAEKTFERYMREADVLLRNDEYVIVHLDGVNFTKRYFSKFDCTERKQVFCDFVSAAIELCGFLKGSRLAYACGDEVSVILQGDAVKDNYNNRIQKICSISSGFLSVKLSDLIRKRNNEKLEKFAENCFFAVKTYNVPSGLIDKYMKWRLLCCKKLIFDKSKNIEECEEWEKFGALITRQGEEWQAENVDFGSCGFIRAPQNEYFNLNRYDNEAIKKGN